MSSTERSPLLGTSQNRNEDADARDNALTETDESQRNHPANEELSTGRLLFIMMSIWVGVFFAGLDSTIVATLSAPISNSFDSFRSVSWLASSYLIANAALQPISGRLTDIFGRRTGLILSNIFFGTGTLICGLAKEEWTILLGRIVAGMGGGCLNSISTMVGSDLIPLRRRGLWQGIGNIFYAVGSGLGGVYGGWIHDNLGWRWAFNLQVPFILVSAILVSFTVKIPVKDNNVSRIKRVDFLGCALLVGSLVLLLLGLNSGGNMVPWSHPLVLTTIPLSVGCLLAFIYAEDRVAAEPVIPVRLLLNRTVLSACLVNWFSTMGQYGLLYYGPIYFQVRGLSATAAGARLIPAAFGIAVGSLTCGQIMRATGKYWWLSVAMQTLYVTALLLIALTFTTDIPAWLPFIYFFMTGMGYVSMLTITLIAFISAVDHSHQAVITSASYAFRSTGATIGITIASAVFQNLLKKELWAHFGDRKNAADMIGRIRNSLEAIRYLPHDWYEGALESYMNALQGVWFTVLGLAVAGAIISLFMREHELHTTLQRR